MQAKGPAIHKFVLGEKEVEGKNTRFTYDRGSYAIIQIESEEEQNVLYKSRNSQEAYLKWNIYIGRKKERVPRNQNQEANKQNDRK